MQRIRAWRLRRLRGKFRDGASVVMNEAPGTAFPYQHVRYGEPAFADFHDERAPQEHQNGTRDCNNLR